MEDDHPPPGLNYYSQNWTEAPVDENHHPVDPLDNIGFTQSQTQILESIITTENLFVDNHAPTRDEFSLHFENDGSDVYTSLQNYPAQQQQVLPTFQSSSSSSSLSGIPSIENWSGNLNYLVDFNRAQDRTKATPWIFSPKLEKLFVQLDKACPVNFQLNIHPSMFSNYQVRGQLVYSKAEDFHDSVERCINHQQKDGIILPHTAHVLRCDDANSAYIDHENMRHSVLVGLKQPAPGCHYVTFCYRFMCLSSCIGSLNRRQTKLIFTLETLNGNEVGRYSVDVRICSCPGRDIKSEEEKFASDQPNGANSGLIPIHLPMFKSKSKKRKQSAATAEHSNPTSSVDDKDKIYNLSREIRGKENFEMVRDVVDRMLALINNPKSEEPHNPDLESKRFKTEP